MKKVLLVILTMLIVISFSFAAAQELNLNSVLFIFINDDLLYFPTVQPEEINGVFYVPIRPYAEALGAQVAWDASTETVVISKEHQRIVMRIRDNTITTESGITLPFAMFMKDHVVMCNYIFPAEHLGYAISCIPGATIARVKNSSATLTDAQIYEKFLNEVEKQKEILRQREIARQQELERAQNPKKPVYLTFDDGPNGYTGKILDLLKQYNAKATFFMLSGNMKSNPNLVKRMVAEGHSVGLHGVTHDVKKVYASEYSVLYEMNIANETLESIIGERTLLVRVPYGSVPHLSQKQYSALLSWGYKLWDWNIDSQDSSSISVSANTVINHTISQIPKLSRPIVLFHDRQITVNALPKILEYLCHNNYEMKAIDSSMEPYNYIVK